MALPVEQDMALVRAAVDRGFVTPAQVEECTSIQKSMEAMGIKEDLISVLVKKGYLAAGDRRLLEESRGGRPARELPFGTASDSGQPSIKGFDVLSVLGRGGMGTVYKARQKTIDRIVALKVLIPGLAAQREYVDRFLREAKAVARFSHKNIVLAYDAGESNGQYYLVMEYVEGRSLQDRLKRLGKMEEKEALRISIEICEALAYIHENGMMHRDIKPENVLINSAGTPKILDLGLARAQKAADVSLTSEGMTVGTPGYISPEQIRGQKDLDIRCDIYSLGCTMFAMVTGRVPYLGETPAVMVAKHLKDPIPDPRKFNPAVSEGLAHILAKCMAKDRKDRYAAPALLLAELQNLAQGKGPVRSKAAPPTRGVHPSAEARRSSGVPFLAIGLALVLGAAVAWFATRSPLSSVPQNARSQEPASSGSIDGTGQAALAELFEDRAAKAYDEARRLLEKGSWADAARILDRLTTELASTKFAKTHGAEIDKAREDCRAAIQGRQVAVRALQAKAKEALSARQWKQAADYYRQLIDQFSDLFAQESQEFRDSMTLCEGEAKAEAELAATRESVNAENWVQARSSLDRLLKNSGGSVTASRASEEMKRWEKMLAVEEGAFRALAELRKLAAEKQWAEASRALDDLSRSPTSTIRRASAEIQELRKAIETGALDVALRNATDALKAADEAYAAKKWNTARQAYEGVVEKHSSVPQVQVRMTEISKRIQECQKEGALLREQAAVCTWALANSYYRRQEYPQALAEYQKLAGEYKETQAYKAHEKELMKRMTDCAK